MLQPQHPLHYLLVYQTHYLTTWDFVDYLYRIKQFGPDLLLLDHYMPPTKGLDLLKTLRKSNINQPKVVAMSSATMANNMMLKHGADFGIVKFELASLKLWSHSS